nr:PQQ-dependent sugar dehydrogenase [Spiractinospora alimapuensis]
MAVLPDRRVLHTNRQGQFRLYDSDTSITQEIASLPVYDFSEDGMQGIALDPDFEENNWVYVYYSPQLPDLPTDAAPDEVEPDGDTSVFDDYVGKNHLSRFQFVDDPVNPTIDLASEQVILEIPINRGQCCHNGGDIDFDSEGNLYLSTGDDTNPFQSDGYTPIDEREYRNPSFDAQRTSSNTADPRGKLLRITVQEDGSYTVPEDNLFNSGEYDHLFPEGTYDPELALPEIYAMGFRNPFRFSVDPRTDTVYLGDYGPDANNDSADRGPRATVEWVVIDEPRNHGWPYCVGPARPFVDFDFETGESGEEFDCAAPLNDSPRNTGLEELPPVTPAEVWYHNDYVAPEFPELGTGGTGPMGGPAYVYDADVAEEWPTAFPEELDGIPLLYEWARNYVMMMPVEDGELAGIQDFLPDGDWNAPMDMEFGPDGSLYVLEYGGGFFVEDENAQLSRVDYVPDGRSPIARAQADVRSGQAPLTVEFTGENSDHPEDGEEIVSYEWDFGDGATSTEVNPTHTYTENGVHGATLTVTDGDGKTGRAGVTIVVGNTEPNVTFRTPPDGAFFDWGDEGPYRIEVTDAEDETIDCDTVVMNSALGHDQHAHPIDEQNGCDGTFDTPADSGHGDDLDLYWVLNTRYTDQGADGLPTLSGTDQVTLNPKRKQAQYFEDSSGVDTETTDDDQGGIDHVTGIEHGDWTAYTPVDLLNIDTVELRVRSEYGGGQIELRQDAPDGEALATVAVPDTGGEWADVSADVTDPGHPFTLYLAFTDTDGDSEVSLFDLNYFEVVGDGITGPEREGECEGTVTFGDVDSGVADRMTGDGCLGELLDDGRDWANHGAFVQHVTQTTRDLMEQEVITGQERSALISSAARSDVGQV